MGILFILKGRTVHALVGMILNLGITMSMVYVKLISMEPTPVEMRITTVNSFEIGFWLTCLSAFLFLSTFMISHFSKYRKCSIAQQQRIQRKSTVSNSRA